MSEEEYQTGPIPLSLSDQLRSHQTHMESFIRSEVSVVRKDVKCIECKLDAHKEEFNALLFKGNGKKPIFRWLESLTLQAKFIWGVVSVLGTGIVIILTVMLRGN